MKSFIMYNSNEKTLVYDDKSQLPILCEKYFFDNHKKCKKFYENLSHDSNECCDKKCPYGLMTIKRNKNIYSGIVIKDENENEVKKIYKSHGDKLSQSCIYEKTQLLNIIDDYEQILKDTSKIRECLHDLSNIGGYFNSMISAIKLNYEELCENDRNIKAMLSLYEMLNYRISLTTKISEIGYKKKIIKTHPLLDKLRIMMSYKAKKRDVKINLTPQDSYIEGSNNLYLAMFILLDNAVKYAPTKSEIEIYSDETQDNVTINIENRGPIILDTEKEKLIISGYRGMNSNTSGNGIGLAIFDEIAKKAGYGYTIKTKNLNDEECLFTVSITLKRKSEKEYNSKNYF